MATRLELPKFQAIDSNGDPVSGGLLYTYIVGTTTEKATYTDRQQTTPNTNPIVLDSSGQAVIYGTGFYKFVLKTSADVEIWTMDNVYGINESTLTTIADYSNDMDAAITAISTTETTLYIDAAATMSDDVTVPATCTVVLEKGGSIALGGYDLTINGALIVNGGSITGAGTVTIDKPHKIRCPKDHTIFGSSITAVTMNNPAEIHPMWYGVTANGSTDDNSRFQIMVTGLAAGSTIVLPEGTILLSNITSFTDFRMLGYKEKCILKHQASSSDHMLETAGNIEIEGVQFDGNKANNTNRTMSPLYFNGTNLKVRNCIFKNSIYAAINATSNDIIDIRENVFKDMDEHSGTIGEYTVAVKVTSTAEAQIWFCDNYVLHTVSDATACPGGIILTGVALSIEATNNYFHEIGCQDSNNLIGNIDLYTDCDNSIICNNRFDTYYYTPLKLSNAEKLVVQGNLINKAGDVNSSTAISLNNVRSFNVALVDWLVNGNIVDCDAKGLVGILIDGDNSYPGHRIVVSNNIVYNPTEDCLVLQYETQDIVVSGNVFSTWGSGDNAILINDIGVSADKSVNIIGNFFTGGGTNIPIYARTNVTHLHLSIVGNVFQDGTPAYTITMRSGDSLFVASNQFMTTPSDRHIDYLSVTNVRVENNHGIDNTVTTGSVDIYPYGATSLDSSGGAITGTLLDGNYIGQIKTIVMTDATTSSTVSVSHHVTSDPEVFTFDAVDETLVALWTGTEWVTVYATATV